MDSDRLLPLNWFKVALGSKCPPLVQGGLWFKVASKPTLHVDMRMYIQTCRKSRQGPIDFWSSGTSVVDGRATWPHGWPACLRRVVGTAGSVPTPQHDPPTLHVAWDTGSTCTYQALNACKGAVPDVKKTPRSCRPNCHLNFKLVPHATPLEF